MPHISHHIQLLVPFCASYIDYTDDPEENLLPGEVNMAKLRTMYLSRRRLRSRVVNEDGSITETIEILANEEEEKQAEEVIMEDGIHSQYN